jgi:hypothetical protein
VPGELRSLLAESRLTLDGLARAVNAIAAEQGEQLHTSRSGVSHWLAGGVPVARTRQWLAEALSRRLGRCITVAALGMAGESEGVGLEMTDDPVSAIGELAEADLQRREFLTSAAYSVLALAGPLAVGPDALARGQAAYAAGSPRVGASDVAAVQAVLAAFTAVDERLGGGHGRNAVVTYLAQDVTALLRGRFASADVRRSMFSVAAQLAYLAGWKAHDAGHESLAQRYYLQAYHLAVTGGARAHAGWVLRIMAHHAVDIGRPDRCVDLAEAAWRHADTVDARTQSLFALALARAHATAGEAAQAAHWMLRGEQLLAGEADDPPFWAAQRGNPATLLASHAGKTLEALGDHRAAEGFFARCVGGWSAGSHSRVRALAIHQLAQVQAAQGHLDRACATWQPAIGALTATRSARTRRAVADIRSTLAAPRHRGSPAARALRAALQ